MAEEPAHLFIGLTEDQTRALEIALEEVGYYMVADGLRDMDTGGDGKDDIVGLLKCLVRTRACWEEFNRPAFHTYILGAIFEGVSVASLAWSNGTDPAKL